MASAAEDDAVEEAVLPDGDRQRRHRLFILFGRLVLLVIVIGVWETLARTGLIPAAFIGQPSKFLPLLVDGILSGKIAVA
ncbi:MAG: hypothetical protein QOE02_3929, partial [Rhodospirillaceae bacterium]|nr:hypothetical protein [Rhodospirillaceae bacterium]